MISFENISKSFGAQTLFEEAGVKLNPRERVGLVGRNGHGKTTLFRLIIGEEVPDDGEIVIPKNYRIGYVEQHIRFTEDTVLKEGMRGLTESERDHHWKVEKVLSGLGFSEADMHRNPNAFSGGYQVRLNLAKVLVSDPDLLLLDEPTNYLDITSIRWIEQFLQAWPRELLLITHDRGFMDKVITHTMAIHRKKIRKIAGDTGQLYAQIAQDEEVYEKTRINDERRQKEIELFISRFRAKARLANMVQSRIKTLEKMEKRNRLEEIRNLEFSFRSKPFRGKHVMTVENLTFSYPGGSPLIRGLNFQAAPGDRICIVGKNGKGKTTLIKLLAGVIDPDKGQIVYNPNITKGFFEQTNVQSLVDSRTVLEEILYADEGIDQQKARNICGAMMFEGDDALKRVAVLSGGEKSRVMLGKLLATPVNLLLLDEPTNHLDMESCDSLLAALDDFDGVVIMVTHNEMFLHTLARRLIVFQDDTVTLFEGSYARFLEKGGWREESGGGKASDVPRDKLPARSGESKEGNPGTRHDKKALRRLRSEILTERGKILKPIEKRIADAEDAIDGHEKELETLNREMQSASENSDGTRIVALSQAIHAAETAIEARFNDLEVLAAHLEEETARFDRKLAQIDEGVEI
ncbi:MULTISPECIES: ATP-binding cassette domain-containing protein [Desulfococcus]|uniref:ABC transporter related protein n=1 Tax=Desulfococcus multivorans DSM 2059 TaxID=1121405 RepID=S7TQ57_DESML|nr:ATP-binding cassette domain-containing protein [Desulfococcus multivorans]AOY57678.1 putative ABC transporter, ATP-binding protein [Desulfococcus multivorans]AQV00080.1 ABC transporter ATP-binding protein [Desulfococcus multivorans]EPR38760.1 ABC transporter related protein [Desulfococcus multivorans DSM 2059]SJZ78699.1 ATP-binding cassette, subfamily F, member 3 [Desulfococcus multivorans DSM 2059]